MKRIGLWAKWIGIGIGCAFGCLVVVAFVFFWFVLPELTQVEVRNDTPYTLYCAKFAGKPEPVTIRPGKTGSVNEYNCGVFTSNKSYMGCLKIHKAGNAVLASFFDGTVRRENCDVLWAPDGQ